MLVVGPSWQSGCLESSLSQLWCNNFPRVSKAIVALASTHLSELRVCAPQDLLKQAWLRASWVGKADQGIYFHRLVPQLRHCSNLLSACRCSVQRVAKRAGVLLPSREALLDDIGFDWTCADALS